MGPFDKTFSTSSTHSCSHNIDTTKTMLDMPTMVHEERIEDCIVSARNGDICVLNRCHDVGPTGRFSQESDDGRHKGIADDDSFANDQGDDLSDSEALPPRNGSDMFAHMKSKSKLTKMILQNADEGVLRGRCDRRKHLLRLEQIFTGSVSSLEIDLGDDADLTENDSQGQDAFSRFKASPNAAVGRIDSLPSLPLSERSIKDDVDASNASDVRWDASGRSNHSAKNDRRRRSSREARWSATSSDENLARDCMLASLSERRTCRQTRWSATSADESLARDCLLVSLTQVSKIHEEILSDFAPSKSLSTRRNTMPPDWTQLRRAESNDPARENRWRVGMSRDTIPDARTLRRCNILS